MNVESPTNSIISYMHSQVHVNIVKWLSQSFHMQEIKVTDIKGHITNDYG